MVKSYIFGVYTNLISSNKYSSIIFVNINYILISLSDIFLDFLTVKTLPAYKSPFLVCVSAIANFNFPKPPYPTIIL